MIKSFLKTHKSKEEQFTELYNECFNYVYSFVFARTAGNMELTEEIVQETFTAVWQSLDSFLYKSTYRTWVCGIAKNKLYEYYRRKTIAEKYTMLSNEAADEVSSSFDLEKIVLSSEESKDIKSALNSINPLYRYTLILKYLDDLNVKQIARILGRTPKAVDGILQRAKGGFIKEYLQITGKENTHGR